MLHVQFLAAVHRRYEAAAVQIPQQVCKSSEEELDCSHPLLVETLFLLTHNYTREHFPGADYDANTGSSRMEANARESSVTSDLSQLLRERLSAMPPGLPDRVCPQRVLGGEECEGGWLLLTQPWRSTPLVFSLLPEGQPSTDSNDARP